MSEIDPRYIKSYINNTYPVAKLRGTIPGFLICFVDMPMIPWLFADPYSPLFLYIMAVPIVFLHLFGFWVIIKPYKRQLLAQLYIGVFGVITSICYLVLMQKLMYGVIGIRNPLYAVISIVSFGCFYPILYRWHQENLRKGNFAVSARNPVPSKSWPLALMGAFGAHVLYGFLVHHYFPGLFAGAFLLLIVPSTLFSLGIHKYMLMKKYPQWLKLQEPYKEKSRRRRKKKSAGQPTE